MDPVHYSYVYKGDPFWQPIWSYFLGCLFLLLSYFLWHYSSHLNCM